VREIDMRWPRGAQLSPEEKSRARGCYRELLLLKPKLAYQARRAGRGMANLQQVLDPAIGLVGNDRERFQNFVDFFEAIVAYHRS
jgi:CRISPR-associated protein Csm2